MAVMKFWSRSYASLLTAFRGIQAGVTCLDHSHRKPSPAAVLLTVPVRARDKQEFKFMADSILGRRPAHVPFQRPGHGSISESWGICPLQQRHQHTESTQREEGPASAASSPQKAYEQGLQSGVYRPDPRQVITVQKLQTLYDRLAENVSKPRMGRRRPSGLTMVDPVHDTNSSATSLWGNLGGLLGGGKAGGRGSGAGTKCCSGTPAPPLEPAVKGLYMYGGVGCGKTMLMDVFVQTAPPEFQVRRTHFHDFMLGIHRRLRSFEGKDDQVKRVADQLAVDTRVLALDEFFVTDVADAMILSRLFGRLWDRGVVLIATSNRAPDKLYENGLQRTLFLPFIERLKVECEGYDMMSPTDYRRLAKHQRGLYFVTPSKEEDLYEEFVELAHGVEPITKSVEVMMGRYLAVPRAAGKVCMFRFEDLCSRPVAAADFLAITQNFHTLALSGVPVFGAANRSDAYRFVMLIDVLYEHRIRVLISAETVPFELFENVMTQEEARAQPQLQARSDILVDDNLGFSKDRTISRLTEMQSMEYLVAHAQSHAKENLLALKEAQALAMSQNVQGVQATA